MATKANDNGATIEIMEVLRGSIDFCILGTSPFICNRMSEKVKQELLAPKGKKTAADKASTMKHNPLREFRDSPYVIKNPSAPTLIAILPTSFKQAMGTAALDTPGAKRAQIERLVSVNWAMQPMYGIPQLFMSVTRSADMNRTPDVRTRAIIPEWACKLHVSFASPILRNQSIINLVAAAGMNSGVGDWRQEKGSGSYGSFKIVAADDPDWNRIVKTGGRKAQEEALANPIAYDEETESLMAWFDVEVKRRGFKIAA